MSLPEPSFWNPREDLQGSDGKRLTTPALEPRGAAGAWGLGSCVWSPDASLPRHGPHVRTTGYDVNVCRSPQPFPPKKHCQIPAASPFLTSGLERQQFWKPRQASLPGNLPSIVG